MSLDSTALTNRGTKNITLNLWFAFEPVAPGQHLKNKQNGLFLKAVSTHPWWYLLNFANKLPISTCSPESIGRFGQRSVGGWMPLHSTPFGSQILSREAASIPPTTYLGWSTQVSLCVDIPSQPFLFINDHFLQRFIVFLFFGSVFPMISLYFYISKRWTPKPRATRSASQTPTRPRWPWWASATKIQWATLLHLANCQWEGHRTVDPLTGCSSTPRITHDNH